MRELVSFKEAYPRLAQAGAKVIAISADNLTSHERFAESLGGLPFPLLSDTARAAISAYGVLNEKGTGARRAVFVVDRRGIIVHAIERYDLGNPAHLEGVMQAVGAGQP